MSLRNWFTELCKCTYADAVPRGRRRPLFGITREEDHIVLGRFDVLEDRILLAAPNPFEQTTAVTDAVEATVLLNQFIYPLEGRPTPSAHASTIADLGSGKLVAAWFGGTAERNVDVGIWISRFDGTTWSAPQLVATGAEHETQDYACWNPVLFQPQDGPLTLFYKVGPSPQTWWGRSMTSTDGGVTWSDSIRLPSPILGPVKNHPVQLSNGTIINPTSDESDGWKVYFEISADHGQSWQRIGPVASNGFNAIQPAILVHPDGRLQALCRSQEGFVVQTWSEDNGLSWSPLEATSLPNSNTGIDAVTLANGEFALAYTPSSTRGVRTPLVVALSADGIQWHDVAVLEDTPGEYSYPTIIQTGDGRLQVTYTWKRQSIHHAVVELTSKAPRVTAPVSASFTEDAPLQFVDLLDHASDPDPWDKLSIAGLTVTRGNTAGVTVDTANHRLTINPAFYGHLSNTAREVISFAYNVVDGRGGSVPQTATITVQGLTEAPVITEFDTLVSYQEDSAAVVLDSNVVVSDSDSANFMTGKLIVNVPENGQPTDRFGIKNVGMLANQISVSGNSVRFGGVPIGTFIGTTSLTVTFNAAATPAAVQALLQNVTFWSTSQAPVTTDRTVSVTLSDGDGGTSSPVSKVLRLVPVNDAPAITGFDTLVSYREDSIPVVLDSNAVVADIDSTNFMTGKLIVTVPQNGQATDRFGIKNVGALANQISVSGNSVSFGGVAIGTFIGTTSLTVTFNTTATPAAVEALLQNVTYWSTSQAPVTTDRTVSVTLSDGDGGTSSPVSKVLRLVPVNDAPVITGFDTLVTYREDGAAVVLDSNVVVTDSDSANFMSGKLMVNVPQNGQPTDRFGIRNVGVLANQISVSGNSVSFGGVPIGTFIGTTSLTVSFNAAATPAAVQALLRNVTFWSTSQAPVTTDRVINVTLSDGDGGTSSPVSKVLRLVPVNDAPVITGFDTLVTYRGNNVPVVLDTNAVVADIDSANFMSGKLIVNVPQNGQATDRFGIKNVGVLANQISVSGNSVSFGGVPIGTFIGTTSLTVTFNAAATPAAVQALLRNVTFWSTALAPVTTDRMVSVTLSDGDGGTSSPVSKVLRPVPAAVPQLSFPLTFRHMNVAIDDLFGSPEFTGSALP